MKLSAGGQGGYSIIYILNVGDSDKLVYDGYQCCVINYKPSIIIFQTICMCIPLEVSLELRFCKFSSNILKYGSQVVKTVAKVALRNPLSTYCNNCLEITDQCVIFNIIV